MNVESVLSAHGVGGGDANAAKRTAQANDTTLAATTETVVATSTPAVKGNFVIYVYLRVLTGTTTVTVKVDYADATGAQTNTLINAQATAVGSYTLLPVFINAVAGTAINVKVTASAANQVAASATILGV